MAFVKRYLVPFAFGLVGCLLALALVRAVNDYQDFCTMRVWVSSMQQLQQQQARQQAAAESKK